MFRHQGKTRTLKHNLQIASVLSFVAGAVNVAGFLAVQRLTTNVTGHFAFLIEGVLRTNFHDALVYLLYIFFFFFGSLVSNFLIELIGRHNERTMYLIPISIECFILLLIAILGNRLVSYSPDFVAYGLLFSMGLQNSLVTTISKATVRTTHLTGLFTDLGIEISQLFFFRHEKQRDKLLGSIRLRLTIILFFFAGGIFGGLLYAPLQLKVLIIVASILILGLIYDNAKFRFLRFRRKHSHHHHPENHPHHPHEQQPHTANHRLEAQLHSHHDKKNK